MNISRIRFFGHLAIDLMLLIVFSASVSDVRTIIELIGLFGFRMLLSSILVYTVLVFR